MAAFTDLQFVALEAPSLGTFPITKNGVTFATVTDFLQSFLDTYGAKELALAYIFRMLTTEDRNSSLTLGEFSYSRRTNMTFDQAREYWESRYRATLIGQAGCRPTISPGGILAPWPVPPAVR